MYAECPHCRAIFRVTEEILAKAGGKVRCGECGVVFEVVDFRQMEDASPPTDEILIATDAPRANDSAQAAADARSDDLGSESAASMEPGLSTMPSLQAQAAPSPEADFELIIEERRDEEEKSDRGERWRRIGWSSLAVILLLLLLAQMLVARRNTVVEAVPALRPLVSGLCRISGCVIDPRRDVARIELAQHSVVTHPQEKSALMIKGTIINKADFAQPYPVIELTLADIQGRPVAARRFAPAEYLEESENPSPQMNPGEEVPIRLEVLDPGKNALAFEFKFL